MKVKVTQKHIDNGDHRVGSCPIALAMKGMGIKKPYVGFYCLRDDNGQSISYYYPRSVKRFIHNFDHRISVEPFTFILKEKKK